MLKVSAFSRIYEDVKEIIANCPLDGHLGTCYKEKGTETPIKCEHYDCKINDKWVSCLYENYQNNCAYQGVCNNYSFESLEEISDKSKNEKTYLERLKEIDKKAKAKVPAQPDIQSLTYRVFDLIEPAIKAAIAQALQEHLED